MRSLISMAIVVMLASAAVAQELPCTHFSEGLDGWTWTNAACSVVNGALQCNDGSGASNINAPAAFLGNWLMIVGAHGQLCFEINPINTGVATPTPLRFTITNGKDRASFLTPPLASGSGSQKFCAPVFATPAGEAPPPETGWSLAAGSDWNSLIQNVTALQFPVDYTTGLSEQIAINDICFSPVPFAEFTSTTGVCAGESIPFTDQSRGATSWVWTFGASGVPSSTGSNPTVVLPIGTHDVTLCINGGNEAPLCVTHPVTVKRPPPCRSSRARRTYAGRRPVSAPNSN